MHAHKPKFKLFCGFIPNLLLASFAILFPPFLFSLSFTLYLLSIHWKLFGLSPSKNLEMELWSTILPPVLNGFARIWSIFKMDTRVKGYVLAV